MVVLSSMSPQSSHSCHGSPILSASLRSIHLLRCCAFRVSFSRCGPPEGSPSDRVPLLTLRSQEGESGSEVKGAVRKENRSADRLLDRVLIFFSALDLGRPPSKVSSGCSGTWSE